MIIEIMNRVLIMVFILSNLVIFRHFYYLIQAFLTSTEEVPVKYRLSQRSLLFLGIAISYILSTIFTGINF